MRYKLSIPVSVFLIALTILIITAFQVYWWRMGQPILFSAFLLSIAVFSFLLLYRNMKALQKQAQLKNDFINSMMLELRSQISTVSVTVEALKSFEAQENPEITDDYLDIFAQEMQQLELMADKVLRLSVFDAAGDYPDKSVL
jgi:two-component system phosphate regulon sensor histidine kinase PhoR